MHPVNINLSFFHAFGYEGHWALMTLVVGFFYQRAKSVQAGYSKDWFISAYSFAILMGFVFARLFHFMFWDTETFLKNPLVVFHAGGGFAILGGTIGTGFGGWVYSRWTGVNFLHWCDSLMTPICLSLALGRLACFLNGDAYGLPTALPWGVTFSSLSSDWMREWQSLHSLYATSPDPLGVLSRIFSSYVTLHDLPLPQTLAGLQSQGVHNIGDLAKFYPPNANLSQTQLATLGLYPFPIVTPKVHPAQLYETILMLIGYVFIMFAEKQPWCKQRTFFLFWIVYGINRLLIETVRGDRNLALAGLTYAQLISILLIVSGIFAFWYYTMQWNKKGIPEPVLK
ncbi:MAG: prolipoprotein diacylglyceryl transferase [Spirochaetia bacterium]|nr:prolipoprotein diacylglyceryl transferase [Spirochaetia bacterium]